MFGFGKRSGTYLESTFKAAESSALPAESETSTQRFSDDEYDKIFATLTLDDLRGMPAERLAGLAALTLAAAEDEVDNLDENTDCTPEIAADFARASALGNLALLKHAGIAFDTHL